MTQKRYLAEVTLKILCAIDVYLHDRLDVVGFCRKAGISDKTFCYWCKKFSGIERWQLSEMLAFRKEVKEVSHRTAGRQVDPEAKLELLKAEGLTVDGLSACCDSQLSKTEHIGTPYMFEMGLSRYRLWYQAKPTNADGLRSAIVRLAK